VVKFERSRDRDFKTGGVSSPHNSEKRGGVVKFEENTIPDQRGFTTEDVLWALGIWSVILTLSPVILFYMLMVA